MYKSDHLNMLIIMQIFSQVSELSLEYLNPSTIGVTIIYQLITISSMDLVFLQEVKPVQKNSFCKF